MTGLFYFCVPSLSSVMIQFSVWYMAIQNISFPRFSCSCLSSRDQFLANKLWMQLLCAMSVLSFKQGRAFPRFLPSPAFWNMVVVFSHHGSCGWGQYLALASWAIRLKWASFQLHGATIFVLDFSVTGVFHEKGEKYISISLSYYCLRILAAQVSS